MKVHDQFRIFAACLGGSLSLIFFIYVGDVFSQLNDDPTSLFLFTNTYGNKEGIPSTAKFKSNVDAPKSEQLSQKPLVNPTEELVSVKRTLQSQSIQLEQFKKILDDLGLTKQRNQEDLRVGRRPNVKYRPPYERQRILVTGGSGFVGSHLIDRLMTEGHEVICLDNYFTGKKENIQQWLGHPNFELLRHDIVNPVYLEVDRIYHLASPASPPHYMFNPVKTIKTNTMGTINVLVYGDPVEHPQSESYWGNVNPIGPRSCYDEGKRVAEALMVAYHKQEHVDIRIARIFNTFGPRMSMNDGRVVSNFISQALQNHSITVYGTGNHTRSFQYISDLVDGNPEERTILEFARIVQNATGCNCEIVFHASAIDDPRQRRPDISRAWSLLKWKPKVSLEDGLKMTIGYFKEMLFRRAELVDQPTLVH
uniref:UDP-glucuronic acid decarboxylase 1 n=1 Tax=Trichuris muris TaxID=70415 RepID=A0A5S6QQA8_TRIMR